MKGVYNFIKGKVFGIKVPPVEGKGGTGACRRQEWVGGNQGRRD